MKIVKKAQLSWFVVMGLVLLVVLALVSWLAYSTNMLERPQEIVSADEETNNVKSYLESCEQDLAEEAFMLIGNNGGKTVLENYFQRENIAIEIAYDNGIKLPSLSEINRGMTNYINKQIVRKCDPRTVTKKEVTVSQPRTQIEFDERETVITINWQITISFDNNTKHNIEMVRSRVPVRMRKVYEAIQEDLKSPYKTNLKFIETLDNMDIKKIGYEDAIVNIIVDHKSKIRNKPFKFFYVAKI